MLFLGGSQSRMILRLLKAHRELYGQQMLRLMPRLKEGGLYTMLDRLLAKGLVDVREETGSPLRGTPRRFYRLTVHGGMLLWHLDQITKLEADAKKSARSRNI